MKNLEMLEIEKKLKLEEIYKEYVNNSIEGFEDDEDGFDMVFWGKFRDFRLSVSGGSESSFGEIGMSCISGFVEEIVMFDDMMSDFSGCYRGDLGWECREWLFEILNKEIKDKEFKKEIKKIYNFRVKKYILS